MKAERTGLGTDKGKPKFEVGACMLQESTCEVITERRCACLCGLGEKRKTTTDCVSVSVCVDDWRQCITEVLVVVLDFTCLLSQQYRCESNVQHGRLRLTTLNHLDLRDPLPGSRCARGLMRKVKSYRA